MGKTFEDTKIELESLGLVVEKQEINHDVVERERVITSDYKEGTTVPKGTTITLVISLGAE